MNEKAFLATAVVSAFALIATAAAISGPTPDARNSIGGQVPDSGDSANTLDAAIGTASECPASAKGRGMGGSKVECHFPCSKLDFIVVEATSADSDARVSATASCGGGGAMCSGKNACRGVGSRAARTADPMGKCSASSDEFWASTISVDCHGEPSAACPVDITCHFEGADQSF
jgi:hypothetical protein